MAAALPHKRHTRPRPFNGCFLVSVRGSGHQCAEARERLGPGRTGSAATGFIDPGLITKPSNELDR